MIEKRGLDEQEERAVNSKIIYLKERIHDKNGLIKEAGGAVDIVIADWNNEMVFIEIWVDGEIKEKIHYSREDLKSGIS